MEKGKQKSIKFILALLTAFTCMTAFVQGMAINADESFNVESVVTYDEEHKNATISFEYESQEYTVSKITGPNGEVIDLDQSQHIVNINGTYIFDVEYQDSAQTIATTTKEVVVDKIESKEVATSVIPTPIGTYTSVVDGATKISIPDYDGVGWANGVIKDVAVTADFADENSLNKKLVINVPEGMRYELISIKEGTDLDDADETILSTYGNSDPLITAISSMKIPKKEILEMGATSGALEYNIIPGIKVVTINLKISVDMTRYYGAHDIPAAITAQAFKDGAKIGNATQQVKAIGTPIGNAFLQYSDAVKGSTELLASTVAEPSIGITPSHVTNLENPQTRIKLRYAKKTVFELYYPPGMEFVGLKSSGLVLEGYEVLEKNDAEGRIVLGFNNWRTRKDFIIEYKVPEGMAAGTYTSKGKSKVTYTWYDKTTKTNTNISSIYGVKVVSSFINSPTIPKSSDIVMDSSIDGHTMFGPNFLVDSTTRAGTKTNQIAEFVIDPNWQAFEIRIPFDASIAGNKVTDIEYKTNLDSTWRTYAPTGEIPNDVQTKAIKKSAVKLKSDEYFTAFRANVGSMSQTFTTGAYVSTTGNVGTSGSLKEGVTSADVTFSIYDKNNRVGTESTVTKQAKAVGVDRKVSSNASASFYQAGIGTNTAKEGEEFIVKGVLEVNAHEPLYDTVHALENPTIYLRQPKGMKIAEGSIQIVDQVGKKVSWTTDKYEERGDEAFYTLTTFGSVLGSYFGENFQRKRFVITYAMTTSLGAIGDYNGRDMIAWEKEGTEAVSNFRQAPITDTYDFNGNGDKTEKLLSVGSNIIKIAEDKKVLVETYLTLTGEAPKAPYVESDPNTLAYFTPGTNADYIVKALNNDVVPATTFNTFIPIPKTGQNFGSNFQTEAFKWDMKLSGIVNVPVGFEALYSTDANATNYETTAEYNLTPPPSLADVVMVQIRATVPMFPDAEVEFKIPLMVDETFTSATEIPVKIGTKNVYNPAYRVINANVEGFLPGRKVGTVLSIAEIGGTIFADKNADGLYIQADGDTPIANHEVELYKWDGSDYVQVLDSSNNPIKVTSNSDGVYLFDYHENLGYETYAVRFVEHTGGKYQYTINNSVDKDKNSDAIISNGIPNPGDNYKGWVLNINPTKPEAKSIGAGFLEYDPPNDLKVEINTSPNKVKVGTTIQVGSKISPTFWNSIQDPTTPYTWEIVGSAAEKAKATLTNNGNGIVTITPAALASGETTFQMTLTIKDVYGNVKTSDPATITVISNVKPTITANDLNVYVGDIANFLEGVVAKDNEANTITLVPAGPTANIVVTFTIPSVDGKYMTAGTYGVTYVIKDKYENEETKTRIVKVNELPKVVSNGQIYLVNDDHILEDVKAAAQASYVKASDVVGEEVAAFDLTSTITTTVLDGPNGTMDFSEVGIYKVKYDVSNVDGKTATKTVDVLVVPEGTVWDTSGSVAIYAQDFMIENEEAKGLTKNVAGNTEHGNVYAFMATVDADGNKTFTDMTTNTTVYEHELTNINKAPKAGGIYDLTFQVEGSGKKVTKLIQVVVKGNTTPEPVDGLALTAHDFTLSVEEARVLAEDVAIQKAGAKAHAMNEVVLETRTMINSILLNANSEQMQAIRNVGNDGGEFKLEFTAKKADTLGNMRESKVEINVIVVKEVKKPSTVNRKNGVETSDATNVMNYAYLLLISGGLMMLRKGIKASK